MLEVDLAGLGTRSQKRRRACASSTAAMLTASVPPRLSSNRSDRLPTTCASVCLLATAPTLLCQLQTLSSAAFLLRPASPHPTPKSRSNLPCSLEGSPYLQERYIHRHFVPETEIAFWDCVNVVPCTVGSYVFPSSQANLCPRSLRCVAVPDHHVDLCAPFNSPFQTSSLFRLRYAGLQVPCLTLLSLHCQLPNLSSGHCHLRQPLGNAP